MRTQAKCAPFTLLQLYILITPCFNKQLKYVIARTNCLYLLDLSCMYAYCVLPYYTSCSDEHPCYYHLPAPSPHASLPQVEPQHLSKQSAPLPLPAIGSHLSRFASFYASFAQKQRC
jgi:hypothetical protein